MAKKYKRSKKKNISDLKNNKMLVIEILVGIVSVALLLFLAISTYNYYNENFKSTPVSHDISAPKAHDVTQKEAHEERPQEKIPLEHNKSTEHNDSNMSSLEHNKSVDHNATKMPLGKDHNTSTIEPKNGKDDNTTAHPRSSEGHDYLQSTKDDNTTKHRPNEVVRKKYPAGTTPKLAIIIDDVSFPWQTALMKQIPYKVTPAFFPPTKGHPHTVRLSKEFPFAMIHLPLESKNYSLPEEDTLTITDSNETIEKRIKRIKEWFPHIVYYNNHTGGTFTGDYNAMDKLIKTMKEQGLIFVDSRTIGSSQAPVITRKYDMFLFSRDVFLDNSLNKELIKTQLIKAVAAAKKHGYAIAIGHPHKSTLEVLRTSKDLLNGVEMVYVNEL